MIRHPQSKNIADVVSSFPHYFQTGKLLDPYASYTYHALQLLLTYNLIVACWPLFRKKDDLADIPLTPGQRKLLGLPPSSKPPTPGSQYVTPPRYARTPTTLSGSPGSKGSFSNSMSPTSGSISGSPFSPGASPLLQKTMGAAGMNGSRRHSYGSPSPLGPGASRGAVPEIPGSPSPMTSKGASVGLNNKWLYDKGRRSSGNSRLYA
jgi:nucleoporin POM34